MRNAGARRPLDSSQQRDSEATGLARCKEEAEGGSERDLSAQEGSSSRTVKSTGERAEGEEEDSGRPGLDPKGTAAALFVLAPPPRGDSRSRRTAERLPDRRSTGERAEGEEENGGRLSRTRRGPRPPYSSSLRPTRRFEVAEGSRREEVEGNRPSNQLGFAATSD